MARSGSGYFFRQQRKPSTNQFKYFGFSTISSRDRKYQLLVVAFNEFTNTRLRYAVHPHRGSDMPSVRSDVNLQVLQVTKCSNRFTATYAKSTLVTGALRQKEILQLNKQSDNIACLIHV